MEPKSSRSQKVDIADLLRNLKFSATSLDSPEEVRARLEREVADAAHQRAKDLFLYKAVTTAVGLVCVVCLIVAVIPAVPDDTRKWLQPS